MKRILTLLAAAMLVFGVVGTAGAIDFKASGQFHTVFGVTDNAAFDKDVPEDNFYARSRIRARLDVIAHENLKGIWEIQVGNWYWGEEAKLNSNMGNAGTPNDFKTRLAYISFNVPETAIAINMGVQKMAVPNATGFGNTLVNNRVAGVTVVAPINDSFNLTGLWARPLNNKAGDPSYNSADVFGLIAGLNLGMAKVSPYALVARIGHESGSGFGWATSTESVYSYLYAGGAAISVNPVEALSLKLDATYATVTNDAKGGFETDGFYVGFAADYAMPFGTPGLFGWYSSGADKKGEGYIPTLGNDGGFGPTRYVTDGATSLGKGGEVINTMVGTMGIGLQVADLSFVDKLSHVARVAYIAGTNDHKANENGILDGINNLTGMDEEITFIEIDFDSRYQLLQNLAAVVEMAYVIPDSGDFDDADDGMFNAQVYFLYNF